MLFTANSKPLFTANSKPSYYSHKHKNNLESVNPQIRFIINVYLGLIKWKMDGRMEFEFPYLLMGFRGNINVITKHVNGNVVVLCADMSATVVSSTSNFSSSTPPHTTHSNSNSNASGWKCIANQNFGSVELVTCQVLDIYK